MVTIRWAFKSRISMVAVLSTNLCFGIGLSHYGFRIASPNIVEILGFAAMPVGAHCGAVEETGARTRSDRSTRRIVEDNTTPVVAVALAGGVGSRAAVDVDLARFGSAVAQRSWIQPWIGHCISHRRMPWPRFQPCFRPRA